MPSPRTVNEWPLAAPDKPEREAFMDAYMTARELQQALYVDRELAVADGRESPDLDPDGFDNPRAEMGTSRLAIAASVNELPRHGSGRDDAILPTTRTDAAPQPKTEGAHGIHMGLPPEADEPSGTQSRPEDSAGRPARARTTRQGAMGTTVGASE